MQSHISVLNNARHATPRVPFSRIKEKILGKTYDLSIVFVSPRDIRKANHYRGKDASTDILAFPLSKTSGEVLISMSDVKKKAPFFKMTADEYLRYLFIHGFVHLKGHDHGTAMTRLEKRYGKLLKIKTPS